MAERTIATNDLFRLRPLTWEKAIGIPKCSVAKLLGTGIEVRFILANKDHRYKTGWHYSAPGFNGFLPASDRAEAKRLAVAALLEWINEWFQRIEA